MQALRAVAAWLVVFHHNDYRPDSFLQHSLGAYGGYGVDIFFAISGFVMVYVAGVRNEGAKDFALRRLLRIVPAYWAATALIIAAKAAFPNGFGFTDWTPSTLLQSLLFIPNENPLGGISPTLTVGWTLNLELFFYAVLTLGLALSRRYAFVVSAVMLVLAPLVWSTGWPYASVLTSRKLYEFVLGMAIAHCYVSAPALRARAEASLVVPIALVAIVVVCLGIDRTALHPIVAGALLIAALCVEARLFDPKRPWTRPLAWLGKVSYSTYVFHLLVVGVLAHYFGIPDGLGAELVRLGLLTLLVLGVSHVGYRSVEDARWIRFARGWLKSRQGAEAQVSFQTDLAPLEETQRL